MGSSPWATGPARSLLQHGLSTGSQFPSWHIYLLWCGVFPRLQVDICSIVDLHGLQGDKLPHHGLRHRLQGNLCSSVWSTSPSFTDLSVCCSHLFSLLSPGCCCAVFLTLLKYAITLLIASALASSGFVFEPAGNDSVQHRSTSWHLLTKATPAAPPLPKPCHTNPIQELMLEQRKSMRMEWQRWSLTNWLQP